MTTTAPTMSVIVVTFNSLGVLGNAIADFLGQSEFELVIIDNHSSDDTPRYLDRLSETYDNVRVIHRPTNDGFAVAVNEAYASTTAPYVLLLNPDTTSKRTALSMCATSMDRDTGLGVVAPLVLDPHNRRRVYEAGRAPILWRVLMHATGLSAWGRYSTVFEGLYLVRSPEAPARNVDWVSGACMLVRRSAWDSVGGLSERWFMYGEDVDFCIRVKREGWRIAVNSSASVDHLMGSSTDQTDPASTLWLTNLFDVYQQAYLPGPTRSTLWCLTMALGYIARCRAYQALSRFGQPNRAAERRHKANRFRAYAAAISATGLHLGRRTDIG